MENTRAALAGTVEELKKKETTLRDESY